jgi:hypothetical protein
MSACQTVELLKSEIVEAGNHGRFLLDKNALLIYFNGSNLRIRRFMGHFEAKG